MSPWKQRWMDLKQVLVDARREAFKDSLQGDTGISKMADAFYSTLLAQMESMEGPRPRGTMVEHQHQVDMLKSERFFVQRKIVEPQ